MLTELSEDPELWASIDKPRFAFYGSLFTIAMDAAIYPLEAVKTRMQVDTKAKATLVKAVWNAARSTVQIDGVRGLYRGFFMFTFGGLPSQGCVPGRAAPWL